MHRLSRLPGRAGTSNRRHGVTMRIEPVFLFDLDGTLIDGAHLLAEAADGLMPWRGRPEPLKRGLIARMPPLDFTEDHS